MIYTILKQSYGKQVKFKQGYIMFQSFSIHKWRKGRESWRKTKQTTCSYTQKNLSGKALQSLCLIRSIATPSFLDYLLKAREGIMLDHWSSFCVYHIIVYMWALWCFVKMINLLFWQYSSFSFYFPETWDAKRTRYLITRIHKHIAVHVVNLKIITDFLKYF